MSGLFANRALHRTIYLLLLTEFFWGMGMFFVLPTTTVPTYLRSLGAPAILLGLTYVAMGALPMALQLFGRSFIERFPRRKRGVIFLHGVAIAPYFLAPALDHLLAGQHAALLLALLVLLLACSQLTMGIVIPVWVDMTAQVIPATARGRYFGLAAGFLALGGILAGLALMGLQQWLGPGVFRGAFLAAGLCYSTAMLAFAFAPIPESAFAHPPEPSLHSRLRKAFAACRLRFDFGRFTVSNCLQAFAVAILPFLVIYATDAHGGLGLRPEIFSKLTLIQALGGGIGAMLLGWLVDHTGSRRPWIALTLFVPVILLLYPHGALPVILIGCTLLAGMLNSAWSVSMPALLEHSPDGDKSGYIAIANLISFPGAVIGPLLIGGLIGSSGYPAAFLLAGLFGLAAFVIALTIRGRRHPVKPASEVAVSSK